VTPESETTWNSSLTALVELKNIVKQFVESEFKYQQTAASDRKQLAETEFKAVVRLPIEVSEYYRSSNTDRRVNSRNDHTRLLVELLSFLTAVALGLVTGITLIVFNRQLTEMKQQTKTLGEQARQTAQDSAAQIDLSQKQLNTAQNSVAAIQRQMRQDQRAWIEIIDDGIATTLSEPISTKITFTNIGKTPARHVDARFVATLFKNNVPLNFANKKAIIQEVFTGILWPDKPHTLDVWSTKFMGVGEQPQDLVIESGDFGNLQDDLIYAVLYGQVSYLDIFGVSHKTDFCDWRSLGRGSSTAAPCATFNNADNN
jgi:hypothetical protein